MGRKIKINCRKVYDNGELYQSISDELIEIQKRMDKISVNISNIWTGADGNNFIVSFNQHIKNFDAVINFLGDNGQLLKRNALEHSMIDGDFAANMERSELDEQ